MAVRAVLGASVALTAGVLPVFLLGALSAPMQAELGFGETALGAAVTAFFVAGAVAAFPGGRLVERIGARRALIGGVAGAAVASVTVSVWVSQWWQLMVIATVAGTMLGLVDPGGAHLFADRLPGDRQGRAFGVKEASVPAASLAAGAVLPLAAGVLGWRPVFWLPVLAVPLVMLLVPAGRAGSTAAPPAGHARPPMMKPLVVVSVGSAAGAAAATAMATFTVPTALAAGWSTAQAGALLACGSVLAIVARLITGLVVDRVRTSAFRLVAAMVAAGAGGLVLLAVAATADAAEPLTVLWVAGISLGFGAGWGWTGLMFLSVVRVSHTAPASAAGVVLTGLGVGGALGPVAFGWAAASASYPMAWAAAGTVAGLGAIVVLVGERLVIGAGRVTSGRGQTP